VSRGETALRESEARYRDILESSHDLVQSVRPDGTFDFVNQAWLRRLGYTAAEVQGLSVFDVICPDLIPNCKALFGRIMNGESVPDHETAFLAKDGSRVVLQGSMIPRISAGKVVATHAFFRDITELRRTENFVKDILETVDEAFLVIDTEYRVLNANRAYCEQIGKPRAEVIGHSCHELSRHCGGANSPGGEQCVVRQVFATGVPHTAYHDHPAPGGGVMHVEVKAFPQRDVDGAIVSAIEIVNDITERKRLEDQLHMAQKMEAIGQLAGGVAHDFNNLLQAILGYGSILQAKLPPGDPLLSHVEQIMLAGTKAAELTHGLLAFSRKQVVNPVPADLNEIVRDMCKILERLIGEDVEMKIACAAQPLSVLVDRSQIGQVLMNLATNARDAMPRGGTLTIGTGSLAAGDVDPARAADRPGPCAVLTVSDTGAGMDRATIDRIFEPFFTTKELGRGTGLGLSIVYGIVQQHHGRIEVASEPGAGTAFTILLPLIAGAPQRRGAAEALPAGGTETVLLAEDEPAVLALLKVILEQAGYTVVEAADGEAALAAFHAHRDAIRLALLDVIMPKMNGRDVRSELLKAAPGVKILFMSGYTDDVIAKQGLLEPGTELVVKPVDPPSLLRSVRRALDSP